MSAMIRGHVGTSWFHGEEEKTRGQRSMRKKCEEDGITTKLSENFRYDMLQFNGHCAVDQMSHIGESWTRMCRRAQQVHFMKLQHELPLISRTVR